MFYTSVSHCHLADELGPQSSDGCGHLDEKGGTLDKYVREHTYIFALPAASPPLNTLRNAAPYSTPCTARFAAPTRFATAWKKGGPVAVPTFPVSPDPRAKMMVMGLQAPESPFWVSPVKSPSETRGSSLDMALGMDSGKERVVVTATEAMNRDLSEGIMAV